MCLRELDSEKWLLCGRFPQWPRCLLVAMGHGSRPGVSGDEACPPWRQRSGVTSFRGLSPESGPTLPLCTGGWPLARMSSSPLYPCLSFHAITYIRGQLCPGQIGFSVLIQQIHSRSIFVLIPIQGPVGTCREIGSAATFKVPPSPTQGESMKCNKPSFGVSTGGNLYSGEGKGRLHGGGGIKWVLRGERSLAVDAWWHLLV